MQWFLFMYRVIEYVVHQVDLTSDHVITAVATQGRDGRWVSQFLLAVTPQAGTSSYAVSAASGNTFFTANTDDSTLVRNEFLTSVLATTVRLEVFLGGGAGVALRWGLYGCLYGKRLLPHSRQPLTARYL